MRNYNFNAGNNRQGHGNDDRRNGNRNGYEQRETAESLFSRLSFDSKWIAVSATPEEVSFAEECGKFMAKNGLTNSKIRSIYGEIKRIQMGEFEKEKTAFYMLKPKVAYALGRDPGNEGLKLFKKIFDRASKDVTDGKTFKNFCNLIEAILAYHKANGGKD